MHSLESLSVADLRFEHEKLRSNRSSLERRLSRLGRSHDTALNYYQRRQDQATRERWLDTFDDKGVYKPVADLKTQIYDCQEQIEDIEVALELVEERLEELRVPVNPRET